MNATERRRCAVSFGVTIAVLSGCGGLPPPIGAPAALKKGAPIVAPRSAAATSYSAALRRASSGYQLLYSFRGDKDGKFPWAGLINVNGTLYGTTHGGGAHKAGTFFSITTTGTKKVLYSFGGGSHGSAPSGNFIAVKGTLYGTTDYGGAGSCFGGCGTVFSITTTGTEKVLYSFAGGSDGVHPNGSLINVNGTLYGTTSEGGGSGCSGSGCGTVFSITMTGTEKVLYSFAGGSDGANPAAGLINVKGTLYGTTFTGGANGWGTVFSVTTTGTEKVVYGFCSQTSCADGLWPAAGLINVKSTLYGTTRNGGANGWGTVFSVTTTGTEKVLYSFGGGSDGGDPVATLIHVNGKLYGTTYYEGNGEGCVNGCGTVFSVTTTGSEKVLHSFGGDADGANPAANLVNLNGTLYSTTTYGGAGGCGPHYPAGCGSVFALTS